MFRSLLCLAFGFGLLVSARAQELEESPKLAELKKIAAKLQYREGTAILKNGLATINVTPEFRFLDAADAQTVLTKIWGNPPSDKVLGMLMRAGTTPFDKDAWAVIVSFDESGYVKDGEAAKMDYAKLLKEMQAGTKESNEDRVKAGYPSIELVNWATQPHYEKETHKIYWAKHLRFSGAQEETLNYCIRALGRRGVLELNAVASMEQLGEVEAATPTILQMVNFQPGHRYADFNASTDKVATYGIAALIAGGVLAKTGILKGLLVGLLAMKKFLIIGAVALYAFIKKMFFGKQGESISRGEDSGHAG